jgi:hypothetical protein
MKTTYKPTYEEIVQFLNDRAKWLEDPAFLADAPARCTQASELRYVLGRMTAHKTGIRTMVHES